MHDIPQLSDIANADQVLHRLQRAVSMGQLLVRLQRYDDDYNEIEEHLGQLLNAAIEDFWLELRRAAPGLLPEDITGFASDGRLFDIQVTGVSGAPISLNAEFFYRIG